MASADGGGGGECMIGLSSFLLFCGMDDEEGSAKAFFLFARSSFWEASECVGGPGGEVDVDDAERESTGKSSSSSSSSAPPKRSFNSLRSLLSMPLDFVMGTDLRSPTELSGLSVLPSWLFRMLLSSSTYLTDFLAWTFICFLCSELDFSITDL